MKYRYSFLVFLAAFLVQGTLLNLFSVFGVTPNLMLCLVVMFSLLYDNQMHGVVFGCIFGVIADMCFMMYAGVSSLGYLAVSLIVMFVGKVLSRENLITMLVLTVISTVLFQFYIWTMYFFFGSNIEITYMLRQLPLNIIYNTAVSAILYQIFIRKVTRFRSDRYYR